MSSWLNEETPAFGKTHWRILGIDPGPTSSGYCFGIIDKDERDGIPGPRLDDTVIEAGHIANSELLEMIQEEHFGETVLAIEGMTTYRGTTVGDATFDALFWSGRFWQASTALYGSRPIRPDIIKRITGSGRASKSQVNKSLQMIYKAKGHGEGRGTKANKGLLYYVTGHAWDALAVALVGYYHQMDPMVPEELKVRR